MQAMAHEVEQRFTSALSAFPRPALRDPLALLEQFGSTVSVRRDGEIYCQGDQAAFCYRVVSGCVRMVKLMEDGRRQVGEFLMAGDLIGFDIIGSYDFAAEAVSDVVLRRYPRQAVDALVERNFTLARWLREAASISLRMAYARLVLLGRKTASERIASFLLEMVERMPQQKPGTLDLPMSRTDMADHLGLTIETVCRVLAHLRRDGTLSIDRGCIVVRDQVSLQQIACEPRH